MLTKLIAEKLKNRVYFDNDCLKQGKASAEALFKEISYEIPLSDLYEVKDTLCANSETKFIPILLEIKIAEIQRGYNGHKYLLQVWTKSGSKVFERSFHNIFKKWASSIEYLIFIPAEGDEGAGIIHIVNLAQKNNTVQISNFASDLDIKFIAYDPSQETLFAFESHKFSYLNLPKKEFEGSDLVTMDARELKSRTQTIEYTIQDVLQQTDDVGEGKISYRSLGVLLEGSNSQLQFNLLTISDFDNDETNSFLFTHMQEYIPSLKLTYDPIIKTRTFLYKEFEQVITLRRSGQIDTYWNSFLQNTLADKFVVDIAVTDKYFYYKLQDGGVYRVKYAYNEGCHFSNSEEVTDLKGGFENILLQKIAKTTNIFTDFSFCTLHTYEVNILIAHGKFVSMYNVNKASWQKHTEYPAEVVEIFDVSDGDDDNLKSHVLLTNNEIYGNVYATEGQIVTSEARLCQIEGEVIRYVEDSQNYHFFYVLAKIEDNIKLQIFQKGKLHTYDKIEGITKDLNIAPVYFADGNSYVIFQDGKKVTLYHQDTEQDKEQDNGQVAEQADQQDDKKDSQPESRPKLTKIVELPEYNEIEGTIHSAASYAIGEHLVLFDKKNIYLISITEKTCTVFANHKVLGLQSVDAKVCYALCEQTEVQKLPTGLRFYDLQTIVKEKKCTPTVLKKFDDISEHISFTYHKTLERFGYIQSLTSLLITPQLHQSCMKFFGILPDSNYLAYKITGDRAYALDSLNSALFTWSLVSGKILSVHLLSDKSYSEFRYFNPYLVFGKVLLKSKEKLEDIDFKDYSETWQIEKGFPQQQTYIEKEMPEYKRFKLIEIIDETTVKEHLSFIHPVYAAQDLYFNDKFDMMIQKLENVKVRIYKAVPSHLKAGATIKWEQVKEVADYPAQIQNQSRYLTFYSPDFSLNINICQRRKVYTINSTFGGNEICELPKDIMKKGKDLPWSDPVSRFFWIDNNTIKLMNKEGIETIIDISSEEFKEIAYNKRFYTNALVAGDRPIYHYSIQPDVDETLVRLQQKSQDYKSAYYLEELRHEVPLYKKLFTQGVVYAAYIENSFTYYHWTIIEQLEREEYKLEDVPPLIFEEMLYNIFPGGDTILHKVYKNDTLLLKIFALCHPLVDGKPTVKYTIPILPNLKGETVLHLLRDNNDYKSLDVILKYLALYDIDHHSRAIKDLIPVFICKKLPEFLPYLQTRMIQTNQARSINRGCLQDDSNGIVCSEIWFDKHDLDDTLFQEAAVEQRIKCEFIDLPGLYHLKDDQFDAFFRELAQTDQFEIFTKKPIQCVINFNYGIVREFTFRLLLIPFLAFQICFLTYTMYIIQDTPEPSEFAQKLPFWDYIIQFGFLGVLALFATYFVMNEVKQLFEDGINYFSSIWNFIDLAAPIGIYTVVTLELINVISQEFVNQSSPELVVSTETIRTVLSITTFFMWFKFLYFLRIFKNTGYLIRMIFEVIYDMRYFFLVLLITIIAFGHSLLIIALANAPGDDQFITNLTDAIIYTYRIILGDFSVDEFGQVSTPVVMILFLLCTIFNMIVMFNLLIAIISESFAKVTANAEQAGYQEMAALISENNYLVPRYRMETYAQVNKTLLLCTDLEEDQEEGIRDITIERISDLKVDLTEQITKLQENVNKHIDLQLKTIDEKNLTANAQLEKTQTERFAKLFRHLLPEEDWIVESSKEDVAAKVDAAE